MASKIGSLYYTRSWDSIKKMALQKKFGKLQDGSVEKKRDKKRKRTAEKRAQKFQDWLASLPPEKKLGA